ncbi:MAG: valine--tRNA ligase [Lentisphaerae bacterium RIFOXYC12_FULL_60_16]|nr:MAG: valine--tRNA ligase [Lentisphaerae bacterium RIFOXYC12_FULL_60_16]OGV86647.1 MAG: valine--tRNA ligase [Lentisphaerae bacterium RIFOXYB12_FULL_60_10]
MDKHYDPKAVESKWLERWQEQHWFHSDASRGGEPYCVVIPPPNVTAVLHLGHALNNVIQDILVRWRRMQGRNVVWMPGTDHAGIATQNVVEKALAAEGKKRHELGRDAFVARVWKWRDEYGQAIIHQLKQLGCSCDWERERFTMDEGLSAAVRDVFVRLFDQGLIYRANYIINWCPRCGTALSDEESEHQDTDGRLYHIRYPLRKPGPDGKSYLVVATTRPETLLGDVAVAVNPKDPRYESLEGPVILPLLQRELVVIRDDYVDPAFGTGVIKVTPAHDPNDFDMGRRHQLEPVNVMTDDARMNEGAGPYAGLDRFECRKRIVADLQEQGLIDKIDPHRHAVGHCYRCDTVVEPRLSPQWFVKMKPLAAPAIESVKQGAVRFVPARWNKVYLEWMENIRDWCISRQIWWGHRIPVFYCDACGHVWADRGQPVSCPKCSAAGIRQDEDVLDTWFSSWLWPFSTFGWPKTSEDLAFYYPTHDLVTASEIIFFWVARMIMAGHAFMGNIPFRTVYIHGTVRDGQGRKMSKSLGNGIDPLEVIKQTSADALRFSLMMITATGQDVYVSMDKFEIGRNFGTKLWNAARFIQMHSEGFDPTNPDVLDPEGLSSDDRHLLARLRQAVQTCTDNLEQYRFNDVAHALYEFVWHQFCDWYLEYAKDILYGEDLTRKRQVLQIIHRVFETSLRLLHPLMPFLSEELWHAMGYGADSDTIMTASWPVPDGEVEMDRMGITRAVVDYVESKHELVRAGRMLKLDYGVAASREVDYRIKPNTSDAAVRLLADETSLKSALKARSLVIDAALQPDQAMPSAVCGMGTVFMPVEDLIDVAAELARLTGQRGKVVSDLERVAAKLANVTFVSKAPAEVVDQQKRRQQELLEQKEKLDRLVETLSKTHRTTGA